MASASVTLKFTTTEFDLIRECLEAQRDYHHACANDESIHPERRQKHRAKVVYIRNLLHDLAHN